MAFVNQQDANEWPGILKYIQDLTYGRRICYFKMEPDQLNRLKRVNRIAPQTNVDIFPKD